jgi:cell division protein FtsB
VKPVGWAALAGALVLAWVAVFGGEYSTFDWLTLRREVAEERQAVRDLRAALDSLGRLAHSLETDPAAQERAAREQFGMIRNGEILYRLVPRTTGGEPTPP